MGYAFLFLSKLWSADPGVQRVSFFFFQRLAVLCFTFASTVDIEAVSMKSVPWMSGLFAGGLFVVLVPLLEERLYKVHIAFLYSTYFFFSLSE